MKFFQRTLLAFFFCSLFFIASEEVSAQGAGIKVIPAVIETQAEPGQVLTETVVVTNLNEEEKQFYVYKRDIVGTEAGGVPIFADENAPKTGFELTEWVSFLSEQITLAPGAEYTLPITITVPMDASPGSHFGGVFVSAEPPRLRQTGAGVGYEVASILSIRIAGDVTDSARIRSFSTDKLFYGTKDVSFLIKIENQGNILIRPRGPMTIRNMFGGEVANLLVNDTLRGVFPNTVEDLVVEWKEEEPGFGRYEAVVALAYDGDGGQKTIDAVVTFWIFPSKIIIPVLVGLAVFFAAIYLFTKMYISQQVARTTGVRRIVSRRGGRRSGLSRFMFVFMVMFTVSILFLILLLLLFV